MRPAGQNARWRPCLRHVDGIRVDHVCSGIFLVAVSLLGCRAHDASPPPVAADSVVTSTSLAPPEALAEHRQDAPRGTPTPVAEGVLQPVGSNLAVPALPVTIQGQQLVAQLDLGTIDNYLSTVAITQLGITLIDEATLDAITLGTSREVNVPISEFDGIFADGDPRHGRPPETVLLGAALLSHYDFIFDGPTGRVQLYPAHRIHFVSSAQRRPAWFPAGITPADCLPMGDVAEADMRVFLPVQANGHAVHSMFDSASRYITMNLDAARVLGLSPPNPHVRLLPPGAAPQYALSSHPDQRVWEATGVTLMLGDKTLASTRVLIYEHLPRDTGPHDPELSVGTDALRDRVFYLSYSSGTVCLGRSHVP